MIPMQDACDGEVSICRCCMQDITFDGDRWYVDFGYMTSSSYCEWAIRVGDFHWHQPMPPATNLTWLEVMLAVWCNNAVNSDKKWLVLDETIVKFARTHGAAKLFQV